MGVSKKLIFYILSGINIFLFFYFFFTDTYPWILICIHLLTLGGIYIWVFKEYLSTHFFKKNVLEIGIIILLFLAAFALRIYKVDKITPGMFGDEVGYGRLGEQMVNSKVFVPFSDDLFAPPTPYLYLLGYVIKLFGRSLVTLRLPAIFFGVVSIPVMYILLRKIYPRFIAIFSSIVMIFLYHHVIISRFDYEMSIAVFFEILSLLFLYLSYKNSSLKNYAASVLCIAGGLYTYLAFRTTALAMVLGIIILILQEKNSLKSNFKKLIVVLVIFFITLVPWLSFSARHPSHVMARAIAISVFHQGFTTQRVLEEVIGNIKVSLPMFFFTGDPNPTHNPGHTVMYNPVFVLVGILGLIYLFKKNKWLAIFCLFLMVPSFVNDIFSVEIFPEFHYPGTGHPSATRVLGIIPIMMFFFSSGLYSLQRLINKYLKKSRSVGFIVICVATVLCSGIDFRHYFIQEPNEYYRFNYYNNGVPSLDAVDFINRAPSYNVFTVALSENLFNDQRVKYFSNPSVSRINLSLSKDETSLDKIPIGIYSLIDVQSSPGLVRLIQDKQFQEDNKLTIRTLPPDPWNTVHTLILFREK